MSVPAVMRGAAQPSRGIRLWAGKNLVYLGLVALVLLAGSGRSGWPAGWGYLVFLAVYLTALGALLARRNPGLLAERSGVQEGAESWDVPLASLSAVWLPLGLYVVVALDERYGWSPGLGAVAFTAGAVLLVGGTVLSTWAMLVNGWFSAVVRLQSDRGQVVVDRGPYRFVRHPGYAGSLLLYLGVALVLGSLWGLVVVALLAGLLALRTAREDRFLRTRLAGYPEYAARVRFRLIPFVW
ncbi:MAG TPA: isoprenylcysteine carboxylmethyltransferase family protein [Kineosporiaceae bacterium]|nr:isoprenylcysteine carboxylmethyltransferase family protein [Kineosporiaceae bacterium]